MRTLFISLLALFGSVCFAQEHHDFPDHPKGVDSTQFEALPFYNEACELYADGQIEAAKWTLKEALTISYSLTEAHLFLGKIYYDEGQVDSAFIFLNSGIDFAIEQDPHHYFFLFETGMQLGAYDFVKHNLKHFKKLYGNQNDGPYEEGYPFTRDDFEFYDASIDIIYDYKNWLPQTTIIDTIGDDRAMAVAGENGDLVIVDQGSSYRALAKKRYQKQKKYKAPIGMTTMYVAASRGLMFFSKKNTDGEVQLFYCHKQGRKWGEPMLIKGSVNEGAWNAYPFYLEDSGLLYWSSDRDGDKDIYVCKFDPSTGHADAANPLFYSNTEGDDIAPFFRNKTFYCASNGIPGFGGFDVYSTTTMVRENGILLPGMVLNMGASFNTWNDETQLVWLTDNTSVLKRADWKGNGTYLLLKDLPKEKEPYLEIQMPDIRMEMDTISHSKNPAR